MGLSGTSFRHLEIGIGSLGAARDIEAQMSGLGATQYFVSSVSGGVGNDGKSWREPKATVATALALTTANQGDVIYLLPGHVESIADAQLDWDTAGVSIIGLGHGSARPRFDFDHANASINIGASSVKVKNITLRPSVAAVLIGIDVETLNTDTLLEDIEVLPGEAGDGTDEFALGIDLKVGVTRTTIRNFKYRQHASAGGTIAGVRLTGASDDILIEGMDANMLGAGLIACVNGLTTLSTNVVIRNCTFTTDAAEPGIELLTGTTGVITDVLVFSNMANLVDAIVADACARFRCENIEVAAESGGVIGTASVND